MVLLPSSNVPLELSPIVFEPLALPATAPTASLTAASTSLPSFGSVTSADRIVTRTPAAIASWADGWLMTGRVVPAGGLIASSLELTELAAVRASSDGTPASAAWGSRASAAAPAQVAAGGRRLAGSSSGGWGFGSPLGRFSVDSSGILLGGSGDGSASVRLVVPAALVGLAALIGVLALVGQHRIDQRRRRLVD